MSCCCTNIYRLCDQVVCDDQDLVLPIPVPADGEYTLELDFLDSVVTKTASFTASDNATFDKEGLNEAYTYTARLRDSAGAIVPFTVETVEYDCVEFTTKRLAA